MLPLRETFNTAAERYHRARPGYPEELFDDLVQLASLNTESRLLEIGPGTGIATEPLARRGFNIRGIELGEALAREARENLAAYPDVQVELGRFEDIPLPSDTFDLVYSATAFHWIEQPVGYQRVADMLKSGGRFAEFRHHHVWTPESAEFIRESQKVYLKHDPNASPGFRLPLADEVDTLETSISESGLFDSPVIRRFTMNVEYTPETFADLLLTFSNHIALPEPNRSLLIDGLADVIRRLPGERLLKTYLVILHVARVRK
ncbi:MAG: methyltransferase domain-containing protein [Thermomicrobiales bacterium]